MKKLILALALVAFTATGAQAATKVHTGFSTDSSGCAACHITHAANAKKLLLSGSNQTEFCYACHGTGALKSPYDVQNGVILDGLKFAYTGAAWADWSAASTLRPSYSGGFAKSYDFENQADTTISTSDLLTASFKSTQSAHNVSNISDIDGKTPWNSTTAKIPGGTNVVAGAEFTCSSCHDPHGYYAEDYDGAGAVAANPRLLRHNLPAYSLAADQPKANVNFDVLDYGDADVYRVTGYSDQSINFWCAGCHDLLNVGKNAGIDKDTDSRYRHAMGVAVNTSDPDFKGAMGNGTPVSTDGKLVCLTCHRAHGTAATMTTVATTWGAQNYDNLADTNNTTRTGAALLRLKNRDVCYNCHEAAANNTNGTPTGTRQAPVLP